MSTGRPLGFWETYKKLSHDYFGGSESLVLHIQVEKELDENLLRQALSFTFAKHPLLQAIILEEENTYSFALEAKFDEIPIHYQQIHGESFPQQTINRQLNLQFDDKKFLWSFDAVVTDKKTHLILCMHHAISDGLSLMIFMLDTLDHYYLLIHDQAYKTPPIARPLMPPVEQLLKDNISFSDYLNERQILSEYKLTEISYQNIVPISERQTHLAPGLEIPYQQLIILKALAKKNGLTLNSLLAAIWIKTHLLVHAIPSANFSFKTPINLRRACKEKVGLQDIGNYVAIVWQNMQTTPSDDIISLAKKYQDGLKENMYQAENLPKEFSLEKLKKTFNIEQYGKQINFPLMIVMTNPGKIMVPSLLNDYFHISTITGGVNLRFGEPGILLGMFEYQKNLYLCFNYVEPLISEEKASQFISNIQDIIHQLCQST